MKGYRSVRKIEVVRKTLNPVTAAPDASAQRADANIEPAQFAEREIKPPSIHSNVSATQVTETNLGPEPVAAPSLAVNPANDAL